MTDAPAERPATARPGLTVCIDSALEGAELSAALEFLRRCPSGSWMQRPDWPALCPPPPRHRHVVLRAFDRNGLAGLGLARLTRMAPGRYLANMRRGPVTPSIEGLRDVLSAFADALRKGGSCSFVFNPRWAGEAEVDAVGRIATGLGARRLPLAEQSLHCATALVDLSGDEAALSARIKPRARRQIRKGTTAGLRVLPAATLAEARLFAPILSAFLHRRGLGSESIPPVERMWDMTREKGAFLLGRLQDRVVAGHVVIDDGDRAFWLAMASEEGLKDIPAGYLLVWEAMKTAQAQGFRWYDMAGAPPRHLLADREIPAGMRNRHQFKTAFAPVEVPLVPAWVLPLRRPDHDILFALRRIYRRQKTWRRARS